MGPHRPRWSRTAIVASALATVAVLAVTAAVALPFGDRPHSTLVAGDGPDIEAPAAATTTEPEPETTTTTSEVPAASSTTTTRPRPRPATTTTTTRDPADGVPDGTDGRGRLSQRTDGPVTLTLQTYPYPWEPYAPVYGKVNWGFNVKDAQCRNVVGYSVDFGDGTVFTNDPHGGFPGQTCKAHPEGWYHGYSGYEHPYAANGSYLIKLTVQLRAADATSDASASYWVTQRVAVTDHP
jgi:hypothetical protein